MGQEGSPAIPCLYRQPFQLPELFIYISKSPAKHFPRLLYQTRYWEICFVWRFSGCAGGRRDRCLRRRG